MTDNIPRQAVIDILDREHDYLLGMIGELGGTISRIKTMVKKIPAAKNGHWIKNVDDRRSWTRVRFICSECGKWQSYGETDYCPRCGAKMDVKKGDYKMLGVLNGKDV